MLIQLDHLQMARRHGLNPRLVCCLTRCTVQAHMLKYVIVNPIIQIAGFSVRMLWPMATTIQGDFPHVM